MGRPGCVPPHARPLRLDLSDSLDHHRIVLAVRAAMERQSDAQRGGITGRQQHAIAAKIVEAGPFATDFLEQQAEAAFRQ